jgi:acetoin utilization deacetylase AcuC-like enzyme
MNKDFSSVNNKTKMTKTHIYTSSVCAGHNSGKFHPESGVRLRAIKSALEGLPAFRQLAFVPPPPSALRGLLTKVHSDTYVHELESMARRMSRPIFLDPDTVLMKGTIPAAYAAASICVQAVKDVLAGKAENAFCLSRPPGHHARRNLAMGFCFFNNVAVAAERALLSNKKVAIVDIDVHHGNGTEEWARGKAGQVDFYSLHGKTIWPATGTKDGGNLTNILLKAGEGGETLRAAFKDKIITKIQQNCPDLILISAGFDAHKEDYVGGNLSYTTQDYGWMTDQLRQVAHECCGGHIVSVLEGGYNPDSLSPSVAAHVQALQGAWCEAEGINTNNMFSPPSTQKIIKHTINRQKRGLPSGLYIEMLERRLGVFDDIETYPAWMEELWKSNQKCLGNWLQEALRRAEKGQHLLARQALHYVYSVVNTIKASPFEAVAQGAKEIPGISKFCDPDDPLAPEHYKKVNLRGAKALAHAIQSARTEL